MAVNQRRLQSAETTVVARPLSGAAVSVDAQQVTPYTRGKMASRSVSAQMRRDGRTVVDAEPAVRQGAMRR